MRRSTIKHDCFAYPPVPKEDGGCTILKEMMCKNGPCRFYATEAQYKKNLESATKRAEKLGFYPPKTR